MGFRNLGEGKHIEAECIVYSSKKLRNGIAYILTDGEAEVEMRSHEFYRKGTPLFVSGKIANEGGFFVLRPDNVEPKESAYATVLRAAEEFASPRQEKFMIDGVVESLRSRINTIAKKLMAAKKIGRFVLMKFHNDADGVAGALALARVLRAETHQQNSALYRVADAMRDVNMIRYERSPLVVFVDCGSGKESKEGLQLLKASGAEIIIIDHHPPFEGVEGICSVFLSPWVVSRDESASAYSAGYLCVEVAMACGVDELEPLAKIACAGDKSEIMPVSDEDIEKALAIDYMVTYAEFGNKLEFYEHALGDRELYSSILFQAKERMERIKEELVMKKRIEGPVAVYVADFEKASAREFPGRGKLTSSAFELVMHGGPVVVLGVWEGGISFRINEGAVLMGISATKIIAAIKEKMGSFIESGGGHGRAASLRIRKGFTKEVLEEVIAQLQASQPQEKQALQPS